MCVENLGGKGQGGEEVEYSEVPQTFCPENPFISPMEYHSDINITWDILFKCSF